MNSHIVLTNHSQKHAWETCKDEEMSRFDQRNNDLAINVATKALEIAERTFGPDHPEVATSLDNLADCNCAQDEYEQSLGNYRKKYCDIAEPLYKRSLVIREKFFGSKHASLFPILEKLSNLYFSSGEHAKGVLIAQQILDIKESTLGHDHPEIVSYIHFLAYYHERLGHYEIAVQLYQRSEVIFEKAGISEHPDLASAMDAIVGMYLNQDQYSKAEPLCQRSLEIRKKMSDPNSRELAHTLDQFMRVYLAQGKFAQAEPLCQRWLEIQEILLPLNAPYEAFKFKEVKVLDRSADWDLKMRNFEDKAACFWERLWCKNTEEPILDNERDFAVKAFIEKVKGAWAKSD